MAVHLAKLVSALPIDDLYLYELCTEFCVKQMTFQVVEDYTNALLVCTGMYMFMYRCAHMLDA